MPFLSGMPVFRPERPVFAIVLGNTLLSTVPGVSGAGMSPEKTVLTPILDSELITHGAIRSRKWKPNTPTGCPTPAVITRAMMALLGMAPLFVNAGLTTQPVVPCLDVYGEPGRDPREGDAVPRARELFSRGEQVGHLLSQSSDFLLLGECVPGGTTTALCVLRGLGIPASVSSSFVNNPVALKEAICARVQERIRAEGATQPLDIVRIGGDPMLAVAAGIASSFRGETVLAGGTQMLAVAAVLRELVRKVPPVVTTVYVRDDPSAGFAGTADMIGARVYYVDPGFGGMGHAGLARYCEGEVKEGIGAGGAMFLARIMGRSEEEIKEALLTTVTGY
ncbi:MAG: TIGR00303 family protein [Methanomicrobiales archaeon]|nr:TIGR00303 family protein [Methanomicrobiales archaeon]MDD1669028.1 TIGR00303 family protein [Methanomicrobiales archaeon]